MTNSLPAALYILFAKAAGQNIIPKRISYPTARSRPSQ